MHEITHSFTWQSLCFLISYMNFSWAFCVEIYTVLGHFSFPATARERRVVLLVHSEENVGKKSGHK